ncbi:MAG: hypothetical protein KTR33_09470, partial [Gammaproteobacteria bacterium]|nr:hypothetical protein [Gammaproteobacteria bacterium]
MKPLLEQLLTDVVQQLRSAGEIPDTPGPDIQIQVMTTTAHGDYATNLALVLAPVIGVSPQVMAGRIVERLPPISQLSQIDISERGYINFYLDTALLHKVVGSILSAGSDYGRCVPEHRQRTVVRLIESRPESPFSLEQSRAVAIAGSLANLLEFTGCDLVREYYVHGGLPAGRDSEIRRDMNEM